MSNYECTLGILKRDVTCVISVVRHECMASYASCQHTIAFINQVHCWIEQQSCTVVKCIRKPAVVRNSHLLGWNTIRKPASYLALVEDVLYISAETCPRTVIISSSLTLYKILNNNGNKYSADWTLEISAN